MKKGVIAFIAFFTFVTFFSQSGYSQFSVSAELRPRAEFDNGVGRAIADTGNTRYYISQRTRLAFDYTKSIVQIRLTAQDVRLWGSGDIYSATGVFGSNSGLDFLEAWVRVKVFSNTHVKVGRQMMKYDNQRLISTRNWNQFGYAYDAFLLEHDQSGWDIDLALSYNTGRNNRSGGPDFNDTLFFQTNIMKTFNFLRVNKTFGKHFTASLYALASGFSVEDAPSIIYMTGTYGFYAKIKAGSFEIPVDAFYQNGKAQSGKDISAYMFGVNPNVTLGPVKLGVGADYFSGDDANDPNFMNQENTFNKFYGGGFGFHGWMNYFIYIKGSTRSGGLVDLTGNFAWNITPKHKLDVRAHFFSLAESIMVDDEIINDKNLGTEIDTRYTYTLNEEFNVNVGFSYYLTTPTFEIVQAGVGGNIMQPYWIWTMLTYTPKIFETN
jgi:hypothetical protein